MHEVLVNRLGGLSLPRKSVVRLTDRPDMTLDVYRGRKTTVQQQQQQHTHTPSERESSFGALQQNPQPDLYGTNRWMTCEFTSFLTIFQSYQDHIIRVITKSCVQRNPVYGWRGFRLNRIQTRDR